MEPCLYGYIRWYFAADRGTLVRTKRHSPGLAQQPEIDIEIPFDQIPGLVTALEENGFLKPRLDDRLRSEDLKITHRLLDLLGVTVMGRGVGNG